MTLREYCITQQIDKLLLEWDDDKNAGLSPDDVSVNSHKRIWWKCDRGHSWSTEVKDRTKKPSGCPYCVGRLPVVGETDLMTVRPEVAREWHPRRNREKNPAHYTVGSEQKMWWQCALGHEWQATIENRAVKGNCCPFCSGKKAWPGFNDLVTLEPELMKEWHPTLNAALEPERLRPASHKRVYWKCAEGHVWDTWLDSRTSKKRPGCPFCAGNAKKGAGFANIDVMVSKVYSNEWKMKSVAEDR